MAAFDLSLPAITAIFSLVVFLAFYIHFKVVSSKYWERRNVPYLKPIFLLGNMWKSNILMHFVRIMEDIHRENKTKKVIGLWAYTKPQLMVMDLELAKRILIKDFNVFQDRGIEIFEETDPLSAHLFFLKGKKWRNLRVKLTPTFTSGKMKFMFPTMVECGVQLSDHLRMVADRKETVVVKELMARFNTDVISSCAFGLQSNCLQNPDSEFRRFGKKIFATDLKTTLLSLIALIYPKISKFFSIRFVSSEVSEFFINVVEETVRYREENNAVRNDFLQLLINLIRQGKLEDVDKKTLKAEELDDEALVQKFSLTEAAAQCFAFFGAGFETSSSALTFALYELARNPDIQTKLQNEIDEQTREGLSYEAMLEMTYLDKVVHETFRKYPPVGNLQRISNAEYHIPELNVTLDKGTTVIFAVRGFHHDPELFPNPERFDPDRFSDKQQKSNRAFLTFGDGPRSCIGNRFAVMQVKVGIIHILKNYNVKMAKSTPTRVKFHVRSFTLEPIGGMPLMFTHRE